jgi:serine/threonine protein kinase/Tol biopolymer transport system component
LEDRLAMLGKTISHYHILEKLGEGGMGLVYKARDSHLDRFVALKVLPSEKVADPERKKRFVQEAKTASALNHPNIIHIYDIDQQEGVDFIAMEFVPGKTLDQSIPRHGMRLNEALKMSVQMADGLAAAHAVGIVHRDLKPGNIMVAENGLVKVLDFGLAKLVEQPETGKPDAKTLPTESDSQTEEGTILGTVSYMSPEQAEGKKLDARSDIFSFGAVLYEMVTGRRAFQGDSKASTVAAILKEEPKAASQIAEALPKELERVIVRCLRKDRERRFQTMADLKVALQELKEELDSGALEALGTGEKAVRGGLWWAGVVTVVAIFVVGLGITGWLWLGPSKPVPTVSPVTAVPLTSYRGSEDYPSFSPDGTQVAFQWCQEGQNCHIYIKQIGVEPPFQLTNATMDDYCPAWSPDGRSIAFIRQVEPKRWALMLIPQRGGSGRQLGAVDVSKIGNPLLGPYLAWTPDSKWLAFPDIQSDQSNFSLFLISVETLERRRLTTPPNAATGDTAPAFSPNGHTLVFNRNYIFSHSDLYLLQLGESYRPQGESKRVETGTTWNLGTAWTPDGREMVFASGGFDNTVLWRMELAKPGKPVRVDLASDNAGAPSISRSGNRLACSVRRGDSNIWRVKLEGTGGKAGKPVQFIASTKSEHSPAYSHDGKRIAYISSQSGTPEVWVCDGSGLNPEQLTSFGGPVVLGPKWSPDGQRIAFYAEQEGGKVYVVSASGGAPRCLTPRVGGDSWPFWSQDGRWLYFASERSSPRAIWKMSPEGEEAIQVTHTKEEADVPHESPDGRYIYYSRGWPFAVSIWRMAVGGGEVSKVLDSVHLMSSWTVRQEGIYFFTPPDEKGFSTLCLYEFATGKTKDILKLERELTDVGNVAISPDGQTILYSQSDESGSDLMLVENFR